MGKFKWRSRYLICFFILLLFIINIHAEQEPVTLRVLDWMLTQTKFLNKEVELFEQANPNIKIKRSIITGGTRYREAIMYNLRNGTMPDVFQAHSQEFIQWAQSGYFHALDRWVTKEFSKTFPKGAFAPGINVYNNHVYSLPVDGPVYWCQLYINTSVFIKAGLVDKTGKPLHPKNWKEVRQFAKIITEKGKGVCYGFSLQGQPEEMCADFFYEWGRVAGGRGAEQLDFLDVDYKIGRYNFTDPGFIKMFDFFLSLPKDKSVYPGYLSMNDEVARAYFADGKIGMMMGGSWIMPGWAKTHPNFKEYEILMIPPFDTTGYKAFADTSLAKEFYFMSSSTKYPEETWKFLSWFAQPEVGAHWIEANCGSSIFPNAVKLTRNISPQMMQFLEIGSKYAKVFPNPILRNPELLKVKITLPLPSSIGVFWGIISGQIPEKNIPKALKDLENRYNKTLEAAFDDAIKRGIKVSLKDLKFSEWNPMENYEQEEGK